MIKIKLWFFIKLGFKLIFDSIFCINKNKNIIKQEYYFSSSKPSLTSVNKKMTKHQ